MDGKRPLGPVVVFDGDHYYLAAVIALLLASEAAVKKHNLTPLGRIAIDRAIDRAARTLERRLSRKREFGNVPPSRWEQLSDSA